MDDIKLMPGKYQEEQKKSSGRFVPNFSKINLQELGGGILGMLSKWSGIMLIVFIILVLISLGLWGYRLSLQSQEKQLSQEIEQLQGQRNLTLEGDFKEIKKGIDNLKKLLADHIYPTRIFDMIEDLVLPEVYFTQVQVDLIEGKLDLKANAKDYTTLAKQIVVLGDDSRISDIEVNSADMDQSGQVASDLILSLNISFLKGKQQ